MRNEPAQPWPKLHAGVKETETFRKGPTVMQVLSKQIMPDGTIRFVATPDGQTTVTAEVTVLSPANDALDRRKQD